MANTYTQLHVQLVFAVQYRDALIHKTWKNELNKYITGIVQDNKHKMLSINGMPDHLHVLIGMRPSQSLSDLMRDIKANSSKWINENKFVNHNFAWQEGYGAFSYKKSDIDTVAKYIQNQENHHKKILFIDEYRSLLNEFEIVYDEKYLFTEPI